VTGASTIHRPADADGARRLHHELRQRRRGNVAYVGGGTALQPGWAEEPADLALIDVSCLPEAQGVLQRETPAGPVLRIGAATRLERLRTDPRVATRAPLLARSLRSLAALGVRHLATLGGNIGWRAGDTLAPLLVLDAQADIGNGPDGGVPLQTVLAAPELPLVLAVEIPLQPALTFEVFEKIGLRAAFSASRLAIALRAQLGRGRVETLCVAVTGAELPARRLWQLERAWSGQETASPCLAELRAACAQDLPGNAARARLALRLLMGHLADAGRRCPGD
jgi:CO/xanthine dehydrogenase FAD-binding subunit